MSDTRGNTNKLVKMQLSIYLCVLTLPLLVLGRKEGFNAYWNIPIETCTKNNVHFNLSRYDIIYNEHHTFYGDKVNIFYQVGAFPHYTKDATVNGGIPQEGSLDRHLQQFRLQLHQKLPKGFDGPAVLDFETYLPSYTELPQVYKAESVAWVRRSHPDWPLDRVEKEAARSFNAAVKPYFQAVLTEGVRERPDVLIGYYHYPYCQNYVYPYTRCKQQTMAMNDGLQGDIFNQSSALFPSVYTFDISPYNRWNTISTKLRETNRVNKKGLPVLPYFWYRYHEKPDYLSNSVALTVMWLVASHGGDGVVLWGSQNDLKDQRSCSDFKIYFETVLGPLVKCFHDIPKSFVGAIKKSFPTDHHIEDIEALSFMHPRLKEKRYAIKREHVDKYYDLSDFDDGNRIANGEIVGTQTFDFKKRDSPYNKRKDRIRNDIKLSRRRYSHKLHDNKKVEKINRDTIVQILKLYCNL